MARTHELRADARRACEAHRGRALASPVPVAAPLLFAAALLSAAAVVPTVFNVPLGVELVVGIAAAVAAVAIAHRTLFSLFAGLALAVIRPYAPGETLRLHLPEHGGDVEAVVVRIGPANTTLGAESGLLVVPNHRLLKDPPQQAAGESCW